MTTTYGAPPSGVRRHTRRTRSFNLLGVLPAELVTSVLEYLPINELWTAARVSRQFYAAAWRAGLFIHRNIDWTTELGLSNQLSVFKEILVHAHEKDLRLSLDIWSLFPGEYNPRRRTAIYADAQAGADELFPLVSAALPLLVYLSVRIPEHFRAQLDGALRFPAPRLRTFRLHRTTAGIPCVTPLPLDLFTGSAPLLRLVTVGTVTLPDEAVPAFAAVSHAVIRYANTFPPVDIGCHFPRLTKLRLDFFMTMDCSATVPERLDLSGLSLRALVIGDDSEDALLLRVVERSVDLSAIPAVEVIGPAIQWNDKMWTTETADMFIRVTFCADDNDQLCVFAVPAHQRWRRLRSVIYWEPEQLLLPISTLPNLSARLAYLRLDAEVVRGFLDLELALPALRDLHIDLYEGASAQDALAPSGYAYALYLQSFDGADPALGGPRVWAPCTALEEITLFALDEPIAHANSRHVAFLAHALGQNQRPKADRAVLALVGVEFARPVARVLLGQTVSAIRTYAFAGTDSPEDYDGGLWECGLFAGD